MLKSKHKHSKHGRLTRLAHAALAVTIVWQLLSSLVMSGPEAGQPPGTFLLLHSYGGLTTLSFAFIFWLVVLFRRTGTDIGKLMPWFSRQSRSKVMQELRDHLTALRQLKLPTYDETAALPSAVHGLGLLLMLGMALLGTIWYFACFAGVQDTTAIHLTLEAHKFLANLVWAYLIGHAALAVIHHYTDDLRLSEMWSLAARSKQQQD